MRHSRLRYHQLVFVVVCGYLGLPEGGSASPDRALDLDDQLAVEGQPVEIIDRINVAKQSCGDCGKPRRSPAEPARRPGAQGQIAYR
jgi:hypothetical protein